MKPIIEVRNLSKIYQIGAKSERYLSLRDRLSSPSQWFSSNKTEPFYALKDVSFDIMPGETVGIIGRNGAGKSTLLKILSRITPPTSGSIKLRGRVASLLEVGTGFHPELTGRENIFFNGAILGMRKSEINRKFDEIIDFSGVEQFLDTPLKQYSSGMQLRLAFAVAAHLEPEILLIDEVLAVGDAEFQKKCLGKMEDISKGQGRTVVVVSHDITLIEKLCKKVIVLENGILLNKNFRGEEYKQNISIIQNRISHSPVFIVDSKFITNKNSYKFNEVIGILITIHCKSKINIANLGIAINDSENKRVMIDFICFPIEGSITRIKIYLPDFLTPNSYNIDISLLNVFFETIDLVKNVLNFEIVAYNSIFENIKYDYGKFHKKLFFEIES